MDSIRALLIQRLNKRIERLRRGQLRLHERHLRDRLLDQAIARLVRVRGVHLSMHQLEKAAQRVTEIA